MNKLSNYLYKCRFLKTFLNNLISLKKNAYEMLFFNMKLKKKKFGESIKMFLKKLTHLKNFKKKKKSIKYYLFRKLLLNEKKNM